MNLKERLTSTEKLLRSIRSGEVLSSQPKGADAPASQGSFWTRPISLGNLFSGLTRRAAPAQPTLPEHAVSAPPPAATPPVAVAPASAIVPPAPAAEARPQGQGSAQSGPGAAWNALLSGRGPLRAAAPESARASLLDRQIRFGGSGKTFSIGVSVSGPSLCIAVIRQSSKNVEIARRFPMDPDQEVGEKGFAALLQASLASMGVATASADIWAILRSSDLDLNVLAVPKLSGPKLDAAVYWTLQKEKKFAEAEYALDYLVLGPTAEARDAKLDVLTCLARRSDVERLRNAFQEAGRPLTGVTAIPNALLALYRRPGAPTGFAMAANIHVEPDFSAIGLYTRDRLLFSRFIRSGAGSMAETLVEHFQVVAKPMLPDLADLELPLPGASVSSVEPPVKVIDPAQALDLLRHVLLGAPRPGFATQEHLLSPEQMLEVLTPAIERLARQVERTLEYYASSQQTRCDALHLSGEIFGCQAISQALAAQLGFVPVVFDPAAILQSSPPQTLAQDRMVLAPALAAALALPDKGVNLIANYKVRRVQEAKRLVTRIIIIGLAGVMLLIGAAGLVLERGNAEKKQQLSLLKAQVAALGPMADESALKLSVEQYTQRQASLRKGAGRLLAMASLADIARRAPDSIRILSLNIDYPPPAEVKPGSPPLPGQPSAPTKGPQQAKAGQAAPVAQGSLIIEGVVLGERAGFDAALSRFVINLQASPMFQMPVVHESGLKGLGTGEQVLHFVMHVGVK